MSFQHRTVIDTADVPFIQLPSGISYRDYRIGKGSRTVGPGAAVTLEMVVRIESMATVTEPGGVKYYSTAVDTPNNELTWVIGSGEILPSLEEGMMGMKRNSLRRIEVPSVLVYAGRENNQIPVPSKSNEDGNRRLKNLFNTRKKADLLFEVLVKKIE